MNKIVTYNKENFRNYLGSEKVQERINELLKDKAGNFITAITSLQSDDKLMACEPNSLIMAAINAVALNLPLNQNLGFAYFVPYAGKAQFQLGYKGFIQLAQRSGQFLTINTTEVREGELQNIDRLTGQYQFSWLVENREKAPVIGYVAYFELLNGFKKTLYMTKDEVSKHALEYSKIFAKYKTGLWKDKFDFMGQKTVIKLLLSRYAPLNTEMAKAIEYDQAVMKDVDVIDVYPDNGNDTQNTEAEKNRVARIKKAIANAKTLEEMEDIEFDVKDDEELKQIWKERKNEIK